MHSHIHQFLPLNALTCILKAKHQVMHVIKTSLFYVKLTLSKFQILVAHVNKFGI